MGNRGHARCPRSAHGDHEYVNRQGKDDNGKLVTFIACKWCNKVRGKL